jgi:hypothetical protein
MTGGSDVRGTIVLLHVVEEPRWAAGGNASTRSTTGGERVNGAAGLQFIEGGHGVDGGDSDAGGRRQRLPHLVEQVSLGPSL